MATPFTMSIMGAPFPKDFWLPTIKAYNETSNPCTQMIKYKETMVMIGANDAVMCRAFLSTLDRTC